MDGPIVYAGRIFGARKNVYSLCWWGGTDPKVSPVFNILIYKTRSIIRVSPLILLLIPFY